MNDDRSILYGRLTAALNAAINYKPKHCCGKEACGVFDPLEPYRQSEYGQYPERNRFLVHELCREVERIAALHDDRIAKLEETIAALRGHVEHRPTRDVFETTAEEIR